MQTSRRKFLRSSIATAAACGLARIAFAHSDTTNPTRPADSIIDTHVYLGHWPHRRLPHDEPADLLAMLRHKNVSHAWAGSFDGLFHKDVAAVNQRLAEICLRTGEGMLIPFGTINPMLPDWEEDVRRCHETFHMPGIRLHPNYHGYAFEDPRFARLLEVATVRQLIVQLVGWMENERHLLLNPNPAGVDLLPLPNTLAGRAGLKLVVTNGYRTADDEAIRGILAIKNVYFDFARADDAAAVRKLIEKVSADRVVFGSCAPLDRFEDNYSKLHNAGLDDADRRRIESGNARKLVAMG